MRICKVLCIVFLLLLCGCSKEPDFETVICSFPSNTTIEDKFDAVRVIGHSIHDAIARYDSLPILIVNGNATEEDFAIVCNKSLWDESSMKSTDYGYWISKYSFYEYLSFDIYTYRYSTNHAITDEYYTSEINNLGSMEYVLLSDKYYSYIIRHSETQEIMGLVFIHEDKIDL